MNIITGYRGTPHITSAQDRAKNQGAFGVGSYILDVGRMLEAEIASANEIRIRDGVLSHQGCVAVIEAGAYDTVEISSGSQGMERIDLIVARYTKDAETNVEDMQIVVIEGTPASSNPAAPSYNEGDIQAGDSPVDMPLYQVNISGISIGSCTLVAQNIKTQAEADSAINGLQSAVSALNSKLTIASGDVQLSSGWTATSKWVKRIGGIVEFYVEVTGGSLTVGWNTIGIFPTGFKPTATYDFPGIDNRSGALMQTKVNSSANALQVYAASAQSGAQVRLHGLFTTAI